MKKSNWIFSFARIAFFAAIAVFIVYCFFNRDRFSIDAIVNMAPENLFRAAVAFILLYALKSLSVVIPIVMLQISVGIIFPTWLALIVNSICALVMISVPYWVYRKMMPNSKDKIYEKYPKVEFLINQYADNSLFLSFFLRILGFLPVDIISSLLGMLKINYPRYMLGSFFGLLPGIIATTFLGDAILSPGSPQFIISILSLVVISVTSFLIYLFSLKAKKRKGKTDSTSVDEPK